MSEYENLLLTLCDFKNKSLIKVGISFKRFPSFDSEYLMENCKAIVDMLPEYILKIGPIVDIERIYEIINDKTNS